MPLLHRSTFLIGFLAFGWIRAVKSADGPANEETGFLRSLQAQDVGAFCNLCKDGGFPGNPSTVTAVLYIDGNPTCRDLYNLGRNSQIPSRLCKPIQNSILQADCGCDKSTAPPDSGGGSASGGSASSSAPPDTASAVPAVTVPTVANFNDISSGGNGGTGGSISSPANIAGNPAATAGNDIGSNFVGGVGFSPPAGIIGVGIIGAGNTGAGTTGAGTIGAGNIGVGNFVPFAGIDFSGVGALESGSIAGVGATSGFAAPGNIGVGFGVGSVVGLPSNIGELGGLNSGSFDVSAAFDSFNSLAPVPLPKPGV